MNTAFFFNLEKKAFKDAVSWENEKTISTTVSGAVFSCSENFAIRTEP